MAPDMRLLDPSVALIFLAAHTSRISLLVGKLSQSAAACKLL